MTTLARDAYGGFTPSIRPGVVQNVAIGSSSAASSAFLPSTTIVRLVATVDCYVAFGGAATSSSMLMKAGVVEYFAVKSEDSVNVIHPSNSGVLNVTEASTFTPVRV